MTTLHQTELPFAAGEMSRADRRNMLGSAMLKLNVDAAQSRILELIFNLTDGGQRGEAKKSYQELASQPWCGCCSISKARSAIRKLRKRGVITVEENIYYSDGQAANSYKINWPGIRALLGFSPVPAAAEPLPPLSPQNTPLSPQNTPLSPQNTPLFPQDRPYKEHSLFPTLSYSLASRLEASQPASESFAGGGQALAERPETITAPPPSQTTAASAWSPADRAAAAAALHSAGYDRTAAHRLTAESETLLGLSAQDVVHAVAEFQHNRTKFRKCGAIGYRLREGTWPADGVVSPRADQAHRHAQDVQRTTQEAETVLYAVVKQARAQGLPPEEIKTRLRQQLPAEFCAARGW